ncbi:MAG: PD40 domain-containing protein [Ignavibacteriae bacterium]|nr:PD40 domain-containing protein [Ignavibacteriota bacterium]
MTTRFRSRSAARGLLPLLPIVLYCTVAGCGAGPSATWQKTKEYTVRNAGTPANSEADDLAPLPSGDGGVYFTSNRSSGDGDGHDRLYRLAPGGAELARATAAAAGAEGEGVLAISPGGEAVFVRCYAPGGVGDCDLVFGREEKGMITGVHNPGAPLNSQEWDSHPSLTADGTKLYFASERHGGHGGSDIWMAKKGSDGAWSAPVNLGEPVNTPGDEKAPRISAVGDTLFFSSDYLPGYGGFDIFLTRSARGVWSTPLNLGRPFNSDEDDAFLARGAGDTLYFCSSRDGGRGGFDLYVASTRESATAAPPPVATVRAPFSVRYTARNAFTLDPIPAFVVFGADGDEEVGIRADAEGRAEARVRDGVEYRVTASHPGYASAVDSFFYPLESEGRHDRRILLTPVMEQERKIYAFVVEFDFNLFNIRPEEKRNLDSVVALLTRYPNSTVVVSGHTDSLGTEMYNIRLGYNRASEVSKYVERYLVGRMGKLRRELEVRTYGEMNPVASNTTDEGRQRNRRVEIAIYRNE